jgi:hypothetical protein
MKALLYHHGILQKHGMKALLYHHGILQLHNLILHLKQPYTPFKTTLCST